MRKSIITINCIIAIAVATAFTACSKEMTHPVSIVNSSYSTGSASHLGNAIAVSKGHIGWIGSNPDSTKTTTQP
jgi:hypothetical protein